MQAGRVQAIAATPAGHPNRAIYLFKLGLVLQARFGRGWVPADLDEAVQAGRQAVAATPAGHPNRAARLSSLAIALETRFEGERGSC